jgi:hypothetical protein
MTVWLKEQIDNVQIIRNLPADDETANGYIIFDKELFAEL